MKPVKDGRPGKLQVVAGSGQFEARPSLLVDREDRVWVAYEVGEHGWGKDQGLLVNPNRTPGAMLNLHRQVKVRVMGRPVREAKPEIASLFPPRRWKVFVQTDRPHLSHPLLWMNGSGRIHLAVRKLERPENGSEYWRPYLLTMTKGGWSSSIPFPYSVGRLAMYAAGASATGSGLWVSWTRDHFPTFRSAVIPPAETMIENVYAARFVSERGRGVQLGDPFESAFPARKGGYRLGVIASSDHVSTHISYAMVWTEERSREAILEAMKSRRTYGATDNIILEFRIGEHFMGEEFTASEVDPLRVRAVGTRPFSEIEILRNSHSIYRQELKKKEVDLTYQNLTPEADANYYYVRVRQKDGQTAWSSPIWVNLVP